MPGGSASDYSTGGSPNEYNSPSCPSEEHDHCCNCLSDEYPGDWDNGYCCGHCTAVCNARPAPATGGSPSYYMPGGSPNEYTTGGSPSYHMPGGSASDYMPGGSPNYHMPDGSPNEYNSPSCPSEEH